MKIAIFTDIHGNKEALKAILDDIKNKNISNTICLGDTIAIGPNSKECLDMIIDNNIEMVLGNHELYYLKGTDIDSDAGEGLIMFHKWLKDKLGDKEKNFLEKCPLTTEKEFNGKKVLFEHFPIDYDSKDDYPFYDLEVDNDEVMSKIANSLDYDLVFVGHEHNEFTYDKIYDGGSSGVLKDDITKYLILDTDTFEVEKVFIKYDRDSFINSFKNCDFIGKDIIMSRLYGVDNK